MTFCPSLPAVAEAIAVLLVGTVIGLVEGNLLPGECQGPACLFTGIVLGYSGSWRPSGWSLV